MIASYLDKNTLSNLLYNQKLMFRYFNINSLNVEQQINKYMYVVDSQKGTYSFSSNNFQKSITYSLDYIDSPPVYCSSNFFMGKYNKKKYLVIPLKEFYFYQSSWISDFIQLVNYKEILEFTNSFADKKIYNELNLFFEEIKSLIFFGGLFETELLLNYNYMLYRNLVNLLLKTYKKNKIINVNSEILLYCKEYILFDYSLFISDYYNREINIDRIYNKLKLDRLLYRDLIY